jgi:thiaminase/transcriptional activator TenA
MATNKLVESKELKDLWNMAIDHPFVNGMTDGSLAHDKFRDYLAQDKILCLTLRGLVCAILANFSDVKDFDEFHQLIAELRGYQKETELFDEMFEGLKIKKGDLRPHPTTEAFCNFVARISGSGSLEDKLVVLYAIEASYMDWAEKARREGKSPSSPFFAKWIDIHYADNLGRLVNWIKNKLNELLGSNGERLTHHHCNLVKRTLQYEIMFWDTAFRPGSSVFPGEFGGGATVQQRAGAVTGK